MGRPLLTDEIIERANRGEVISDPPLVDDEETKIIRTDQGRFGYATPQGEFNQDTMQIEVDREVVKSRRIENQKRGVFQAKLNKILLWIILLLVVLIIKISDKPKAFAFLEKVGNNENWNYRGYARRVKSIAGAFRKSRKASSIGTRLSYGFYRPS